MYARAGADRPHGSDDFEPRFESDIRTIAWTIDDAASNAANPSLPRTRAIGSPRLAAPRRPRTPRGMHVTIRPARGRRAVRPYVDATATPTIRLRSAS